jgi:hypothetical protein
MTEVARRQGEESEVDTVEFHRLLVAALQEPTHNQYSLLGQNACQQPRAARARQVQVEQTNNRSNSSKNGRAVRLLICYVILHNVVATPT